MTDSYTPTFDSIYRDFPMAAPYDTALPQDFVDDVRKVTGFESYGHFVWSYANGSTFGFPYPIDAHGVRILINYLRNGGSAL